MFNYDTPCHPDDYVHRIGRTGRAGAKGRAFTFVAPEDAEAIDNVEKLTGNKVPVFGKKDVRVELPKAQPKQEKPKQEEPDENVVEEHDEKPKRSRSRRDDARQDTPKPRQEKRESRSQREEKPRQSRHRNQDDEPVPAGEWNGPKPDFLGIGFN